MDQPRSDEPSSRFFHVATSVSDGSTSQVIVWGGETTEFYTNDARRIQQLASVVEQFDVRTEVWCQRYTRGNPHPGLSTAACASLGNYLFVYGGHYEDKGSSISGVLSCLDVKTLTWSQLCPAGIAGGSMRKAACGMVHFHHDKLAVIGGYGIPSGPAQPGSTFIRDTEETDGRGWTNEIHIFDLSQGVWFSSTVRGTRPPPSSDFTLTSIDNHRAILFGGYQPGHGFMSDLYIFDFNIMEITKVEPCQGEPWPVGRDAHVACCLGYVGGHIHLLVTGGRGGDGKTLKDSWLFSLSLKKWKEVTLPDGILPRRLHSTTAITLCPGLVEVIVFGGTTEDFVEGKADSSYSRIAETAIITFSLIGSEWEVVGVASNNKLTASERVREKMLLKSGTDTQGLQLSSTLDSEVTPYALYRPERGGVQVRREISSKNKDFQAVLRQKQPDAISAMIKWTSSVHQTSIKKCLPSPAPPQPGTSEKSKMAKTEPASPSMITSTEETTLTAAKKELLANIMSVCTAVADGDISIKLFDVLRRKVLEMRDQLTLVQSPGDVTDIKPTSAQTATMVTQSHVHVKEEPLEEVLPSAAVYSTSDDTVNTETGMEIQSLGSPLALVRPPRGIMETQPTLTQLTGFRGVEVCGETTVVVTNGPQNFTWKGYGLKLHISKGCLPAGTEQCTINIKASLAGQYEFPENSHLVSAIFWLRCEPRCKFTEALTLELDHCAKVENIDLLKLHFVRAICSQKHLPYVFEKLGGTFNNSCGAIELNSFSGVAITQEGPEEREYCAMLFYLIVRYELFIHFVVTWNTETHLTRVRQEYEKEGALRGHIQPVEFATDKITLDIPMEGTSCTGWTISPLFPPVVIKKNVDSFEPGKMIPSCQLSAEFNNFLSSPKTNIPSLKYHVKLQGAKKPYDSFLIKPPTATLTSMAEGLVGGIKGDSGEISTDSSLKRVRTTEPQPYSDSVNFTPSSFILQSQNSSVAVQDSAHNRHVPDSSSIYGYPIRPPSQLGGLQTLPIVPQGTRALAQHNYYSSQQPVVHHTPYIHGNQAPPPPMQQASHLPWQPTMHQPTNNSGLQTSASAIPSTQFQQDGGDVASYKTITIEDVANQASISLDTLLDECSPTVLLDLAKYCVDWQLVGKRLGLPDADITAIDNDNTTEDRKRVGVLEKWKDRCAFRATYHVFIEALLSQGMSQAAVEACKVIGAASSRH